MTKPIAGEGSNPKPDYSASNNATATNNATVDIPVINIRPSTLNPRKYFDEAALEELTNSVRIFGVEQAITVRPFEAMGEEAHCYPDCKYEIVMGERRWRAACGAGLTTIPARIVECSDEELVSRALVENLVRSDLSCIEIAHGYKALADKAWTQEKIASQFSTDQPQVSLLLGLLRLPEYVQGLLQAQRLSKSHGFALLTIADEEKACSWLAKCALDESLPEKELRDRVRAKRAELDDKKKQPTLPGVETTAKKTTETTSMDKEPKLTLGVNTTKDTNGLTRKDADAQLAAAMAPDPDVVPLSERVQAASGAISPEVEKRISLGNWIQEIGLSWIEAADKLRDITGPGGDVHKPGMWFWLESETAQKLMDLCDWHEGELGTHPMHEKLQIVVEVYHGLMLERRVEAEKAKAALSAGLPVFEEVPATEADTAIQTFEVSYCYPRNGEWEGGGICETEDESPAYFDTLAKARAFACEDSLRNARFLIHVVAQTEYPKRKYDRSQRHGDLWYFQGRAVPGGVSDSIPDAASLAQVGCVIEEIA